MPESSRITFAVNGDGELILSLPQCAYDSTESWIEDGTIRLFLTENQAEVLSDEIGFYRAERAIAKAQVYVANLPRESVRKDLGRAAVKVLQRLVATKRSKQAAEAQVDHLFEVFEPVLKKFGVGKEVLGK